MEGRVTILEYLLDNGGDVNLADHFGIPPVFLAVQYGNPEIMVRLLAHGVDITVLYKGDTVLHCAVREDKIRHSELLIGYGHAHDAPNQDNLTPIQLAQKLGRTRILSVLDNPASRQRLLMKPKVQFANRKVDPPQPVQLPVVPAEPANQPLKKESQPPRPIDPPQPASPPVVPAEPANQPLKKESQPPRPIVPPHLPPTVPMFAQPPPDAVYPTAAFPPGPAMFTAAPASPFAGSYYPFAPGVGGGLVYIPIDEFTSLQHRLLLLERTTAQIMRDHTNLCSTCHGKLAAAQCPSCGQRFCTPHWAAHVADGCRSFSS
jgi:hypothetical protein